MGGTQIGGMPDGGALADGGRENIALQRHASGQVAEDVGRQRWASEKQVTHDFANKRSIHGMRDAVFEGQQLSAASDFLLYKIGAHGSSDREGREGFDIHLPINVRDPVVTAAADHRKPTSVRSAEPGEDAVR
jgi:hypothetical protein